jgi:hypothetical protein
LDAVSSSDRSVEAVWGADPVEAYGGITSLIPDNSSTFHSPLVTRTIVRWQKRILNITNYGSVKSSADLHLEFEEVDWFFAQKIYVRMLGRAPELGLTVIPGVGRFSVSNLGDRTSLL